MPIISEQELCTEARTALTAWVAVKIVTKANDKGEDARTYTIDEEVVEQYIKELVHSVSLNVPDVVKFLSSLPPHSIG